MLSETVGDQMKVLNKEKDSLKNCYPKNAGAFVRTRLLFTLELLKLPPTSAQEVVESEKWEEGIRILEVYSVL